MNELHFLAGSILVVENPERSVFSILEDNKRDFSLTSLKLIGFMLLFLVEPIALNYTID